VCFNSFFHSFTHSRITSFKANNSCWGADVISFSISAGPVDRTCCFTATDVRWEETLRKNEGHWPSGVERRTLALRSGAQDRSHGVWRTRQSFLSSLQAKPEAKENIVSELISARANDVHYQALLLDMLSCFVLPPGSLYF